MRHESCLVCLNAPLLGGLVPDSRFVWIAEITGMQHHHHAQRCGRCGAWWFDDIIRTSAGVRAERRGTVLCECPDEVERTGSALVIPEPESACHCTAATVTMGPPQEPGRVHVVPRRGDDPVNNSDGAETA